MQTWIIRALMNPAEAKAYGMDTIPPPIVVEITAKAVALIPFALFLTLVVCERVIDASEAIRPSVI
jgi:hypothetical protein